jgi:hypothetical protein
VSLGLLYCNPSRPSTGGRKTGIGSTKPLYICELTASTTKMNVNIVTARPIPSTAIATRLFFVTKNRIAPTNTIISPTGIPNDSAMIIHLQVCSTNGLTNDRPACCFPFFYPACLCTSASSVIHLLARLQLSPPCVLCIKKPPVVRHWFRGKWRTAPWARYVIFEPRLYAGETVCFAWAIVPQSPISVN